jgi:hypothetical protein
VTGSLLQAALLARKSGTLPPQPKIIDLEPFHEPASTAVFADLILVDVAGVPP